MEKMMYYAGIAENYYNAACPSHAQNGYEKNVLICIETEECIFVPGEIQPEEGQLAFRCRRTKGITVTTLKMPKNEKKKEAKEKHFNYPQYKGIVFTGTNNEGFYNTYIRPTFKMPYDSILTTKLCNMDEFMDVALKRTMFERQPFEALRELEMQVQEVEPGYLLKEIAFTFHCDRVSKGKYLFQFSHFEKITAKNYCAVYRFMGEIDIEDYVPFNIEEL